MARLFDTLLKSVESGSDSPAARVSQMVEHTGAVPYPGSFLSDGQRIYFLSRVEGEKRLAIISARRSADPSFQGRELELRDAEQRLWLTLHPTDSANAERLRVLFPHLAPRQLQGNGVSVGFGDRLGLATPGHIESLRSVAVETGSYFEPVFAQQSIRENARTGRTPEEVIDDATWGVFQEGWKEGYAADADHLKTEEDVDVCVKAGYTFYTIDPGAFVQDRIEGATPGELESLTEQLPWEALETNLATLKTSLLGKRLRTGDLLIEVAEYELLKAAVKYGRAVAHTTSLYRHLCECANVKGLTFGLEVSVDETSSPTSPVEHLYVAHELRRLGVDWSSLAPRFPGFFEKGVDYRGEDGVEPEEALKKLDRSVALHCLVMEAWGPYKLSLHSGSDKFSVYPVVARRAGGKVHLKTAGTSYLEALRAVARLDPDLFRRILAFAVRRYAVDRESYHVSAETSSVPDIQGMDSGSLPLLLENFHCRQVLHVTFGSVLAEPDLKVPLFNTLRQNEQTYKETLKEHFLKHLRPFAHQD